MSKWNRRFIELAKHISQWSKDPSTQVGAVVVRPDKTIASLGFNGFPQRVIDLPEWLEDRETKLDLMVHAEINALTFSREPLDGYTLYVWPLAPCIRCAAQIAQSGISRVVAVPYDGERWQESLRKTEDLFQKVGISLEYCYD